MAYFVLLYHTSPDYLERRGQHRVEHLALARAAHERGELLLAGALQNPVDAALLVWKCADRAPIHAFIDADPYVKNGLVTRWEIRDWYVVVADDPMPV